MQGQREANSTLSVLLLIHTYPCLALFGITAVRFVCGTLDYIIVLVCPSRYIMAPYNRHRKKHLKTTALVSSVCFRAEGQVSFEHRVDFTDNAVLRFDDYDAGDGGAIAVGPEGQASFEDFSYFTSNVAESGGQGGAMANSGSVVFGRASYFISNIAKGEGSGFEWGALRFMHVLTSLPLANTHASWTISPNLSR